MVSGGLFGAVFSVLLNRFLYTPFIRLGARPGSRCTGARASGR